MSSRARRIGILAGGGSLPREFADAATSRGDIIQIVALKESADKDLGPYPTVRVSMGQIGKMIRTFRKADVDGIVIIGPVRRADIVRIRPDLGFLTNLAQIMKIIASAGDDSALRGVVRFFEGKGFQVLGPSDIAPETLAPLGRIAGTEVTEEVMADVAVGFDVIRALGDFDIGQAVIVGGGRIEAVEGAEGTNVMLERYSRHRRARSDTGPRGVLIKRPKPGQELRVDMPSIGPATVRHAAAAGLGGIAVQAGNVLIAERQAVIREADRHGIFVCGAEDLSAQNLDFSTRPEEFVLEPGPSRRVPSDLERRDAQKGRQVMKCLGAAGCGKAIVVARGHVLAVEAGGEPPVEVLERVATYRRRHGARTLRNCGTLITRSTAIDRRLVEEAVRAGLTALAIPKSERGDVEDMALIQLLDRHNMSLLLWDATGNS
jgi:DUF1009 family protein